MNSLPTAAPLTQGAAWIDGAIVPISEAKISVLDWGFLRSDATYDVIHCWKGRLFRLDDHLDRFYAGMDHLRMDCGLNREQLTEAILACTRATGLNDAYVEVICTRGQPQPGSRDPRSCRNQLMVFAIPFVYILKPGQPGLSVLISERQRISARSFDPRVKNYLWLDMVMGLYEAYDHGAESVILVDDRGNLCEGPGFNIFLVRGNRLSTPRAGVLEGITRKTVMELASNLGLPMMEADLAVNLALEADEVFATSTAGGIMPITRVNNRRVGNGEPGAITQQLITAYWELHVDQALSQPVQKS